ncbi:MAG: restriction endonuclease [Planctomycetes bacterium SCN 63-9]|nr:MAG: restriction endonuclease [Planctomycetes bacterium SCN 63-9]
MPKYYEFFNPVLRALKTLGGSGTLKEINNQIIESSNFTTEAVERLHNPETGNGTEIEYRLAWARSYLKQYGLIDNSARGVWSLTQKAETVNAVNPEEVLKHNRAAAKAKRSTLRKPVANEEQIPEDEDGYDQSWKSELYHLLTSEMSPATFERLVQRLLRESGFVQVEVTGRSGDGGIDGKGIARIHGIMSFHVIYQCKRYKGVVSSSEIRDFRGSMVGRSDKGLFITTGTFSRDAIKEATRDGAPPIDLLDGDQLSDKLKELRLGIKVETVEQVTVNTEWFMTL